MVTRSKGLQNFALHESSLMLGPAYSSVAFCRFLSTAVSSPGPCPTNCLPADSGGLLLSGLSFSCYLESTGRHWGRWQNTELSVWLLLPQASQSRTICARCGKPRCLIHYLALCLSVAQGLNLRATAREERSLLHNPFDPDSA